MSELMQSAGDDQVALIGCAAALVVSGAIMYFSFYVGKFVRGDEQPAEATVRKLPPAVESTRRAA